MSKAIKLITLFFISILVILLIMLFYFLSQKPSNSKNWVAGMDKQANINFAKQMIIVSNFRQWRYKTGETVDFTY